MNPGGGSRKGAKLERLLAVRLSLWITHGARKDVLWRSSMSGGRATVSGGTVRQAGDLCAVSAEGCAFIDHYYVESKHVKKLDFMQFVTMGVGKLARFWIKAKTEAKKYKREPLIIARQNNAPIIVVSRPGQLRHLIWPVAEVFDKKLHCDVSLLDALLKVKYHEPAN